MPRVSDDTGSIRRVSDDTGSMRRVSDDTGSIRRVSDDTGSMRPVSDDTGGMPKQRGRAGGGLGSLSTASGAFPARRTSGLDDDSATAGLGTGDPAPRRRTGRGSGADLDSGTGEMPRRRTSGAEAASEELPIVRKPGNGTESWAPAASFSPSSPAGAYPSSGGPSGAGVPWPTSFDSGSAGTPDAGPLSGLSAAPLWSDNDNPGGSFETAASWSSPGGPPPSREPVVFGDGPPLPGARPQPPRQSRLVTVGMALLGVVALAVVAVTGVVYYSGEDNQIREILGGGGGGDQQVVSGPINDMNIATFELMAATDRVRLRIDDLGTDLYRVSTPEGSGTRPSAEVRDERLRVDLNRDTAGSGGEIEVVLSAKVRWTIRFSGYSAERIVDLTQGRIKAIELVGGTRRAEMNLAQANGTVPMRITGGIEELILRAPTGSPVRIKVGGGAATVTAGSKTLKDVAPGSTLTPKDWTSGNRYDVDAVAPVTLLKVETSAPS
ncbi:hypothetical protein [Actinoplanes derwentensis]|uniref:Uncharacterized protein n=1 Tax=Actinoplanes derwentensis TaxID=113562 RepID=A0A1H2CDF6_9ACTN|nr:hypothetical protein [Actinoplanes derwentensis]GID89940.1 hypothetical protein Ade03nite_88640 [Actinoplanes derwentensis]SDT68585.1 hypothetical protein SAMN04489716_5646 [Actinoplanes derwentensis]